MNVDVEIYMNNFIKFFRENPDDLFTLIPKGKEDEFYRKVKLMSLENTQKGDDPSLTQKQILEICVVVNGMKLLSTTLLMNFHIDLISLKMIF